MTAPLVKYLGLVDYAATYEAMRAHNRAATEATPDEIWLLEHPPVFTLGLAGRPAHILDAGDIPVLKIDRGGQVTYHGPGQLVAYLLLGMRERGYGVRELVRRIEQAVIGLLGEYGVAGVRQAGMPGVYTVGRNRHIAFEGRSGDRTESLSPNERGGDTTEPPSPNERGVRVRPPAMIAAIGLPHDDSSALAKIAAIGLPHDDSSALAKIAAIGLRVANHATYHGLSLNVNMDLSPFGRIDPCGYAGLAVSQLADFGVRDNIGLVGEKLARHLKENLYDRSRSQT